MQPSPSLGGGGLSGHLLGPDMLVVFGVLVIGVLAVLLLVRFLMRRDDAGSAKPPTGNELQKRS